MKNIKHLLGIKIKELRIKQGLSQQQLAEMINIDQRNLSNIECGNTFPSKCLFELSTALKTPLNEIFDFEYLGKDLNEKIKYIKENIDGLEPDNIDIIYRLIKTMH